MGGPNEHSSRGRYRARHFLEFQAAILILSKLFHRRDLDLVHVIAASLASFRCGIMAVRQMIIEDVRER
jgi:hypothetical protein